MSKSVVSEVKGRFISASEVMNRFGKVGKKIVSVKKQGFFSSQWYLRFVLMGQRNIRLIRMFMSVAEVKETFG